MMSKNGRAEFERSKYGLIKTNWSRKNTAYISAPCFAVNIAIPSSLVSFAIYFISAWIGKQLLSEGGKETDVSADTNDKKPKDGKRPSKMWIVKTVAVLLAFWFQVCVFLTATLALFGRLNDMSETATQIVILSTVLFGFTLVPVMTLATPFIAVAIGLTNLVGKSSKPRKTLTPEKSDEVPYNYR